LGGNTEGERTVEIASVQTDDNSTDRRELVLVDPVPVIQVDVDVRDVLRHLSVVNLVPDGSSSHLLHRALDFAKLPVTVVSEK
jgi:hypothetical protein